MSVLHGLVVCGGQSTRMGMDKSQLQYHGVPQREWLYELLQPLCEDVYISCNAEQAAEIGDSYQTITDATIYRNIGPMAALLSAYRMFPNDSFLLMGCDYPYIKRGDIQKLVREYNGRTTVYFNDEENVYEPLLGIYTPEIRDIIQSQHDMGQYSLQWILKQANAQKIIPEDTSILQSVDTRMGYMEALVKLSQIY